MVLCDCVFVFQVSFVSVVYDQLMCAASDLCVICVWTTMLIVMMSSKYRNRMHVSLCIATEVNATVLVMCTV